MPAEYLLVNNQRTDDMELATKISWLILAFAVHGAPSAVLFVPKLTERLYGVDASGEVGVLLIHRGALFFAVLAVAVLAAFDPGARKAASVVVAISMIGFLIVYASAGLPQGPLRTVALVDAAGLLPLMFVLWRAWSV